MTNERKVVLDEADIPPAPVHAIIIIDESGSMTSRRSDVVGGFNRWIADQKLVPGDCRVSLIMFNDTNRLVWSRPLREIEPLTEAQYKPAGSTALWDAVAAGLAAGIERPDSDERTLMVVITDGEENASRVAKSEEIAARATELEAAGWTFVYLGASMSNWARQSAMLGQSMARNAAAYSVTKGYDNAFASLSMATQSYRGQQVNRGGLQGGLQAQAFWSDEQRAALTDDAPLVPPPPKRGVRKTK